MGVSERMLQMKNKDAGDQATNSNKVYLDARRSFDSVLTRAKIISRMCAGRKVNQEREFWASVIFTRLVVMSITLLNMSPRVGMLGRNNAHWDLSSVASIARNIAECYLLFFYLCVDELDDEDEWEFILLLIQIKDNYSRMRMFREWDPKDNQLGNFLEVQEMLRGQIRTNRHFLALSEKKQNDLLRVDKDHMTQDKILEADRK